MGRAWKRIASALFQRDVALLLACLLVSGIIEVIFVPRLGGPGCWRSRSSASWISCRC
jgi:hypothetical protein